jgi:hypothetical protein
MKKRAAFAAAVFFCAAVFCGVFSACKQADDSPPPPPAQYAISVDEAGALGEVSADRASAAKGTKVTLTVTPAQDYEVKYLRVEGASGARVPLSETEPNAEYSFSMPAEAVSVSYDFISKNAPKYDVTIDVSITHGTLIPSHEKAAVEVEVTIYPAPDESVGENAGENAYELASVTVSKAADPSVFFAAEKLGNNYVFSMPAYDVVVTGQYGSANAAKKTIEFSAPFEADGTAQLSHTSAPEGTTVTITTAPAPGYEVDAQPAGVRVRLYRSAMDQDPVEVTQAGTNLYTFVVPEGEGTLRVYVSFGHLPSHTITIDGTISAAEGALSAAASAYETAIVTVTVTPAAGFVYWPGSLKVTGSASTDEIAYTSASDSAFTFVMPAENVELTAKFISEDTPLYDVTLSPASLGSIQANVSKALAEDTVTLTLKPQNADYRYKAGTLVIAKGEGTLTPLSGPTADGGNTKFTFTMPAENVTVSAQFELIPTYEVSVAALPHGTLSTSPSGYVRAGTVVTITLTVTEPSDWRYKEDTLSVTKTGGEATLAAEPVEAQTNKWTFTMPADEAEAGAVTVSVELEEIPKYALGIDDSGVSGKGTLAVSPEGPVPAGTEVTITLTVSDPVDYRYQAESILVEAADGSPAGMFAGLALTQSETEPAEPLEWTFTMPDESAAEDLRVSAAIELIPRHTVTNAISVTPNAGSVSFGNLVDDNTKAREGQTVSLTVTISDTEEYWLVNNSISVTTTAGSYPVPLSKPDPEAAVWTFVMPAEAVTVSASLATIPFIQITKGAAEGNGTFTLYDIRGDEEVTGADYDTRGGRKFTVSADPEWAYKVVDAGPASSNGGQFEKTGDNTWTFTMGAENTTISVAFETRPESVYELYKGKYGGINPEATENHASWGYYNKTTIDYDTAPGRQGGYALRIIGRNPVTVPDEQPDKSANDSGENCMTLIPGTPIDLSGISALSFWAKVNNNNGVYVEFMGFGSGNYAVVYTNEAGNGATVIQTQSWKRYIVPVPAPTTGAAASRVFIKLNNMNAGTDLYVDDVEFVSDTLNRDILLEIPSTGDALEPGISINVSDVVTVSPRLKFTSTADGLFTTLTNNVAKLDAKLDFSKWDLNLPPLEYIVEGNATVLNGVITTTSAGSFTLKAKMGTAESNAMTFNVVAPSGNRMIDNFEGTQGSGYLAGYPRGGEHYTGTDSFANGESIPAGVNGYAIIFGADLGGRNFPSPMNLSYSSKIVFWAWANADDAVAIAGKSYKFKLKNGDGSYFSATFTLSNYGGAGNASSWNKITIPFTALTPENGGSFDASAVTGFAIECTGTTGTFAIDNLRAEE